MSRSGTPSSKSAASSILTPTTTNTAAPIQLATKSAAAAPTLNKEMELGTVSAPGQAEGAGSTAGEPATPENGIMQLARIGDIVAMEKLFESGESDATYSDDEGITPLHVRPHALDEFI